MPAFRFATQMQLFLKNPRMKWASLVGVGVLTGFACAIFTIPTNSHPPAVLGATTANLENRSTTNSIWQSILPQQVKKWIAPQTPSTTSSPIGSGFNLFTDKDQQRLSISNYQLTIERGNTIELPNRPQSLELSQNTLSLSESNSITFPYATSQQPGWLAPRDYVAFSQRSAVSFSSEFTTSTGTVSLSDSGVTAGTYGSSNQIPVVTVNSRGRITAISNQSFSAESPLSFNNGLNRSSNTIQLGGALTQSTSVPLAGYNLSFSGSGNIGIGITAPTATLDVSGTIKTTNLLLPTGANANYILTSDANGVASWSDVSATAGPWTASGENVFPDATSRNIAIGATDAGTAKLYVNGSVGIGTTDPTGYQLNVAGAINAQEIRVNGAVLNPGTGSNWTVSGNNVYRLIGSVGIGTATPANPLHVNWDQNGSTEIYVQNSNSGNAATSGIKFTNDTVGVSTIRYHGNTYAARTTWQNQLAIAANASANGIILAAAKASGQIKLAAGSNTNYIMTVDGTTSSVSIGTTTPTKKLDIWSPSTTYNSNSTGAIGIQLSTDNTEMLNIGWDDTLNTTGAAYFQAYDVGVGYRPMYLNPAGGGVVIGLNNPPSTQALTIFKGANLRRSLNDALTNPLSLSKDRAGTMLQNNDEMGVITFDGFDGTSYLGSAYIFGKVDGVPSLGNMPGNLGFYTRPAGGAAPLERLRISAAGNVGIGTTNPGYPLDVQLGSNGDVAGFTDTNGTCTINPTSTALICTSDSSKKKNVSTINNSLDIVGALRGVNFNWLGENTGDQTHLGFIAQEVEQLLPSLVSTNSIGIKSVNYLGFAPILANAIGEQQIQIQNLQSEQVNQKSSLDKLVEQISQIIKMLADITNRVTTLEKGVTPVLASENIAGYAVINQGASEVAILFTESLPNVPIVSITPLDSASNYFVSNVSETGFTLKLQNAAEQSKHFSWSIILAPNATTTASEGEQTPTPTSVPIVEQEPELLPSETPVPTATISPIPSTVAVE